MRLARVTGGCNAWLRASLAALGGLAQLYGSVRNDTEVCMSRAPFFRLPWGMKESQCRQCCCSQETNLTAPIVFCRLRFVRKKHGINYFIQPLIEFSLK
jgi:hypothetical protein